MIVWQITGDEISPDGNGAAYFATLAEALVAIRDHRAWRKDQYADNVSIAQPVKIKISTREQLAAALNDAMGYGCS